MFKFKKNGKTYLGTNAIQRASQIQSRRHINLTKESIDFLNGELLGDGHLQGTKEDPAIYRHWSKHKSYLQWLSKTLASFGIEQGGNITFRTETKQYKNGKIKKYIAYQYHSKSYIELGDLYNNWYLRDFSFCPYCEILFHDQTANLKEWKKRRCPVCNEHALQKKTVPKDIELTPVTLRQWYIGDGGCAPNYYGVRIPMLSFLRYDNNLILKKLWEVGFEGCAVKKRFLRMRMKNTHKFLNYIGLSPVKCYEYKWNYS